LPRTFERDDVLGISQFPHLAGYCEARTWPACECRRRAARRFEALVANVASFRLRKRGAILCSASSARETQSLTDADFVSLGDALECRIWEVISMAALAVYANISADADGDAGDAMFSQFLMSFVSGHRALMF